MINCLLVNERIRNEDNEDQVSEESDITLLPSRAAWSRLRIVVKESQIQG